MKVFIHYRDMIAAILLLFANMPAIAIATPQAPTYCNVAGPLTMETCSLINRVLAENYFNSLAHLRASQGRPVNIVQIQKLIDTKCNKVRRQSFVRYGNGTMIDIVENECLANEFHKAASTAIGKLSKRESPPENSTHIPQYLPVSGANKFGMARINHQLALDFLKRVIAASQLDETAIETPNKIINTANDECSKSLSNTANQSYEAQAIQIEECIRDRLHSAALDLLHL